MNYLKLVLCIFLTACAHTPSPVERRAQADMLAGQNGWRAEGIQTRSFELLAYLPGSRIKTDSLTIYIEGDGFAWVSGAQPSRDPTPRDPVALRLALAQPGGVAVYLGRPCQYVDAEAIGCSSRYWTELRFAPAVINATNEAIDVLKQRFGASHLTLVGYSGGGAVAALIAARRKDVERLITVAGNLDHQTWTSYHRVPALTGSLNPADEIVSLQEIRQWHFVGERDGNITPALVRGFSRLFPQEQRPLVQIEAGFDHRCCWVEKWPEIWQQVTGAK